MPDGGETGGVGGALKRVREGRRMSLRQIADTTKLSVPALEAIERNDVRKLPGGLFARSFVRAYASELGLDVERTVREFFAQFPELNDAPPPATVDEPEPSVLERLPANTLPAVAIGVPVVALVAWVLLGWHRAPEGPPPPLMAERIPVTRPDTLRPQPLRPLSDVVPALGTIPGDDAPAVAPEGFALTLHVTARRPCWVAVTADGRQVVSRLLGAGEEEAVRAASELRIKIGDASAVSLRLNGSPVRALGGRGEVVTVLIDASTVADLLVTH
jgi:cytoskeletal protein RodZ